MTSASDRFWLALAGAAVLSAAVLSSSALHGQPLAMDEHVSYYASGAPTVGELNRRSLDVMATPPLSHLIERASLSLLGVSETSLRLPSILGYGAAIVVALFLGRTIGGMACGAIAALLLAWHPDVIDEVRIARCYGLELLLGCVSLWMTCLWLLCSFRPRITVGWIAANAALLWTHYLSLPLIAIEALICAVGCVRAAAGEFRPRALSLAIMLAAVGASAWPLVPSLLRLQEWSPMLNYRGGEFSWREAVGPLWYAGAPAAIAAGLLMAVVWRRATAEPFRCGLVVAAAWLIPLAVFITLAAMGQGIYLNVRYRIPLAPANAAVLAILILELGGRRRAFPLTVVALGATWWAAGRSPMVAMRLGAPADAEWKQAAIELKEELADPSVLTFAQTGLTEAFLVPTEPTNERFLHYVACRLGKFYSGSETARPLPLIWQADEELRAAYLQRLRSKEIQNVVIVGATDTDLNRESVATFEKLVAAEGFELDSQDSRPSTVVIRYSRRNAMLAGLQRTLIYQQFKETPSIERARAAIGMPLLPVEVTATDGIALHGWLAVAGRHNPSAKSPKEAVADGRLLAIWFNGNGGHRGHRLYDVRTLGELGLHTLNFDYRGYAENAGKPSEEKIAADARAIWNFATVGLGVSASRIVIFGESLGGGVSVRLVSDLCREGIEPGGLVLRATFSSLVDAASYHYPWLPVRAVLKDRYPSVERIGLVTCPILVAHGHRDQIVPFEQGRKLFQAAPQKSENGIAKRFAEFPNADHNDILETSERLWVQALEPFLNDVRTKVKAD
jgi:fermentation-respiration switch protein FrsA (DUF1100 family)